LPEGDTLRRAARALSPILVGQEVTDIWFRKLRGYRPRVGQRVENVQAVGKHLLIEFDRNLTLDTHLGMSGSWRTSSDLPRPHPALRVTISTALGHALCFGAPTIQTFVRGVDISPAATLGPDISDDDIDIGELVLRSRSAAGQRTLADLLLDQSVAAGVGNVFKSEALFVARLHPFTTVDRVDDDRLGHLWRVAHRQLVFNRDQRYRSTTAPGTPGRTYVYRRFRLGCRRCDNSIDYSPAGLITQRSSYWCPTCQPTDRSPTRTSRRSNPQQAPDGLWPP
jgi:endonuclease VIII